MMRIIKIIFLAAILALFIPVSALAEELEAALPRELQRAAPEVAGYIKETDPESGYGLLTGVSDILMTALSQASSFFTEGLRSMAMVVAGVVLLGAAEGLSPGKGMLQSRCISLVGAVWVTTLSAANVDALIGLGMETIGEITRLSRLILPALGAAAAATGNVTGASLRQVAAVLFSNLLLTMIEKILLPMVYLYIGIGVANTVVEGKNLETLARLLKKGIIWVLSGLVIAFIAYLTIGGAIAGSADARAVRLVRSAVSVAVPVVGGILSQAAESLLAGAGVLKGLIGAFGTLAVLSVCVTPFLHLGCQYLLYQGAAMVASTVGPGKINRLLSTLAEAFSLVLAMTGAACVVLLITLMSSLTAVAF